DQLDPFVIHDLSALRPGRPDEEPLLAVRGVDTNGRTLTKGRAVHFPELFPNPRGGRAHIATCLWLDHPPGECPSNVIGNSCRRDDHQVRHASLLGHFVAVDDPATDSAQLWAPEVDQLDGFLFLFPFLTIGPFRIQEPLQVTNDLRKPSVETEVFPKFAPG